MLGSGRSLAPPVTPSKANNQRSASQLSPSVSSVSLSSQTSSTPISTQDEDIMSKVDLGDQTPNGTASAAQLVCPICNEEMVSMLLQGIGARTDGRHRSLCYSSIGTSW